MNGRWSARRWQLLTSQSQQQPKRQKQRSKCLGYFLLHDIDHRTYLFLVSLWFQWSLVVLEEASRAILAWPENLSKFKQSYSLFICILRSLDPNDCATNKKIYSLPLHLLRSLSLSLSHLLPSLQFASFHLWPAPIWRHAFLSSSPKLEGLKVL